MIPSTMVKVTSPTVTSPVNPTGVGVATVIQLPEDMAEHLVLLLLHHFLEYRRIISSQILRHLYLRQPAIVNVQASILGY